MRLQLLAPLGLLLAQLSWAYLIEQCEGVDKDDKCTCAKTVGYSCPPGFYCPEYSAANDALYHDVLQEYNCEIVDGILQCPCTPGFYCPANTSQPSYCCKKYYCPTTDVIKPCKAGYYCNAGQVEGLSCSIFSDCPEKSSRQRATGIWVLLVVIVVLIWAMFQVMEYRANRRRQLQDLALNEVVEALKKDHDVGDEHGSEVDDKYTPLAAGAPASNHRGEVEMNEGFTIEFERIGLTLKNGTTIMQNVSGKFLPGRLCAVMGPSGAGKTTIISLVTGKAQRTTGTIRVNGNEVDGLGNFKKLVGFVPQEDIMLRELTVRDNIAFSAHYRLPKELTEQEIQGKINHTLAVLDIAHVQHTVIGDERERGVSGGQRKRVNIGIELVAAPMVLFLDEPTSGLDSTTSTSLCRTLKTIARERRMTIVSVIHQPSITAFHEFDDLLLLGKGGRVVYCGPLNEAQGYFSNIGFPLPHNTNPADFYLDVCQGAVPRDNDPNFKWQDLFVLWEEAHGGSAETTRATIAQAMSDYRSRMQSLSPNYNPSSIANFTNTVATDTWFAITDWFEGQFEDLRNAVSSIGKNDPIRATPGGFVQFGLCFKRACKQVLRNFKGFMMEVVLHLGCGIVISVAADDLKYIGPLPTPACLLGPVAQLSQCQLPQSDQYPQIGNFLGWGILVAAISASSGTFGNEQVNYFRESAAGLKTVPYFFAKWLADLPRMVAAACFFWLALNVRFQGTAPPRETFLIVLMLYWFGWSLGFIISQLVNIRKAALTGVLVSLVFAIGISGVNPALSDVKEYPPVKQLPWKISGPRWAIEAFYVSQVAYYKKVPSGPHEGDNYIDIDSGLEDKGYVEDNYWTDISTMLALGVGYGIFALILMNRCYREKKK